MPDQHVDFRGFWQHDVLDNMKFQLWIQHVLLWFCFNGSTFCGTTVSIFDEDVNKVDNNEGLFVCTLQQLLLQHPETSLSQWSWFNMSTQEFEETLSQLNIVSTIYWCNNEGGIMPSPDEVHQSTVERNSPRWWIAFITGQHCGFATKVQRRIDFIPGGINLPYLNETLISTSPFMAVSTWLDWCKLRDLEIPNTLILVSWVEDILQQRL